MGSTINCGAWTAEAVWKQGAAAADDEDFDLVELAVSHPTGENARSFVLTVPADLVDVRVHLPAGPRDSLGGQWLVSRRDAGDRFRFAFARAAAPVKPGAAPAAAPWTVRLSLNLRAQTKPVKLTGLALEIPSETPVGLPPLEARPNRPPTPGRRVWIESDVDLKLPVNFGDLVALTFNIVSPGAPRPPMGTFRGSMLNANAVDVTHRSRQTLRVTGKATYTLTARAGPNGEEVSDSVTVQLQVPSQAVVAVVRPPRVLPGGPLAIFFSGVNVRGASLEIHTFGRSSSHPVPDLRNAAVPRGQPGTFRRSTAVSRGPEAPDELWEVVIRAPEVPSLSSADPRVVSTRVRVARAQPVTELETALASYVVRDLAAGQFFATINEETRIASAATAAGGREVEWVALAVDEGVVLVFRVVFEDTERAFHTLCKEPKGLAVTAIGGPAAFHRCVAAIQAISGATAGIPIPTKLVEFDLFAGLTRALQLDGSTEQKKQAERMFNPVRRRLDLSNDAIEERDGSRLRLAAIGTRVYVAWSASCYSADFFEAGGHAVANVSATREPALDDYTGADWDIVAVPARDWKSGVGSLYLLDRAYGSFMRMDATGGSNRAVGTLTSVAALRPASAEAAKLDLLNWAQFGKASEDKELVDFERLVNTAGEYMLEASPPEGKRGYVDRVLNLVDETASLVAVGGALVLRSTLPDKDNGGLMQGRAYDPRLNVWVRCGHMFPGASASALIGATTPSLLHGADPSGDTGGAVAPYGSLFCFDNVNKNGTSKGTLYRLFSENLLELLGFNGLDLTPSVQPSGTTQFRKPCPASRFRGRSLPVGTPFFTRDYLQTQNGLFRVTLSPDGILQLLKRKTGKRDWMAATDLAHRRGDYASQHDTLWQSPRLGVKHSDKLTPALAIVLNGADGRLHLQTCNPVQDDPSHQPRFDFGVPKWSSPAPPEGMAAVLRVRAERAESKLARTAAEVLKDAELVLEENGDLHIVAGDVELWRAGRQRQTLQVNEWLVPGDSLIPPSSETSLVFSAEGKVEVLHNGVVTWTFPVSVPCGQVALSAVGEVRLLPAADRDPAWTSFGDGSFAAGDMDRIRTAWGLASLTGAPGWHLRPTDWGGAAVRDASGFELWRTPRSLERLAHGVLLRQGDTVGSPAGAHLAYGRDGVIRCVYNTATVWAFRPGHAKPGLFGFGLDGRLQHQTPWAGSEQVTQPDITGASSGAGERTHHSLTVGPDGVLEVRDASAVLWRSDANRGRRLASAVPKKSPPENLGLNECLRLGDFLESPNGTRRLLLDRFGEVRMLQRPTGAEGWASTEKTHGQRLRAPESRVAGLALDQRGKLYLFRDDKSAIQLAAPTATQGPLDTELDIQSRRAGSFSLELADTGNVEVVTTNSGRRILWYTWNSSRDGGWVQTARTFDVSICSYADPHPFLGFWCAVKNHKHGGHWRVVAADDANASLGHARWRLHYHGDGYFNLQHIASGRYVWQLGTAQGSAKKLVLLDNAELQASDPECMFRLINVRNQADMLSGGPLEIQSISTGAPVYIGDSARDTNERIWDVFTDSNMPSGRHIKSFQVNEI